MARAAGLRVLAFEGGRGSRRRKAGDGAAGFLRATPTGAAGSPILPWCFERAGLSAKPRFPAAENHDQMCSSPAVWCPPLGKGTPPPRSGPSLESRGLKVTHLKLDPYINVDPGTMSPFQHNGEVFVTEDGAETDLDLGHYRALHQRQDEEGEQLHHRPDLRVGDQEGTARRVSRQDGAGHPASPTRSRASIGRRYRCRRRHRRGRRHGRRHRVAALPRSDPPDGIQAPSNACYHAPDAAAVHPDRRRDEDQTDPALGQGTARDRHPARHPICAADRPIPADDAGARSRCSAT